METKESISPVTHVGIGMSIVIGMRIGIGIDFEKREGAWV